jgi:hypothetical protein
MKKLTEEKESSLAALRKKFENAKSSSNAEVERVRKNAEELKATIQRRIANNNTTQANKYRLEKELQAARNASAKFEKQLTFVKNEQARKNAVRSVKEKKKIEELSNKIKQLNPGNVRTSPLITEALLIGNDGLTEQAMNRVLNQHSVPSRVFSSKQEQNRQDYIASRLHEITNPLNMYELLIIEPTNTRIKQFKNYKRVNHRANNTKPAPGKPSSIGISTRKSFGAGGSSKHISFVPGQPSRGVAQSSTGVTGVPVFNAGGLKPLNGTGLKKETIRKGKGKGNNFMSENID